MKKGKMALATVAALAATVAVAVPVASSAPGPGQTVKVKSTITIGKVGYRGKVTARNANCVEGRKVVLKQRGRGVISRATTNAKGSWTADLDELNQKIKIPAKVFAEVKPVSQGTAGPIYRCLSATSKTVEIAGG